MYINRSQRPFDGKERAGRKAVKFKHVDIIDTLRRIMESNTSAYQSDFVYDEELIRSVVGKARECRRLLWMSRDHGTWMFHDRDVAIRDSPEYGIWHGYQSEENGIRAFWIWVEGEREGIVIGNILEVDYDAINREFSRIEENAVGVHLVFERRENSRDYTVEACRDYMDAIVQRYGTVRDIRYKVHDEQSLQMRLQNLADELCRDAECMRVDEYLELLEEERTGINGYHGKDLCCVTQEEAEKGIRHHLKVYGIRNYEKVLLHSEEEILNLATKGGTFCMDREEKKLFSYLENREDNLFSREEQTVIYQIALLADLSEQFPEMEMKSILYKLERTLGKLDEPLEEELEADSDEMEQEI